MGDGDQFGVDSEQSDLRRELQSQHDQLAVERQRLIEQVSTLDRRMGELSAAICGIDRIARRLPLPDGYEGRITIKQMAMEILRICPSGAPNEEIRRLIWSRFGVEVSRESLSPQLSRLAEEDRVIRRGKVWFLTQAGRDALIDIGAKRG